MAWEVEYSNGVWLPQTGWWLDARFPAARSFVSHAHFDHLAAHREILCSAVTARLMRARLPAERIEHVLPFGQTEALTADCAVTLHPAGHIFGSAQALLAHDVHGTLLYTGDFKLRRGRSAEPCATPQADVLVMETTYGRPRYVFPPTAQVVREIARFCHGAIDDGETPVLFGYSLGKSQEILSGLAEARLPVMLHPETLRLTRVYEELGLRFPDYRAFAAGEVAGHVVICPPQSPDSSFLRGIPARRTAMITGWALDPGIIHRCQCDAAFPLSDHADFADLLAFVEQVRPTRVLTLHGFAREFALTLRERGFDAWAIGQDNQLEFRGFAGWAPPAAGDIPGGAADRVAAPAAGAADAFARFAATAEQIRGMERKLEKIALLGGYLASLASEAAAQAAVFFTGRPFPQSDGRALNVGWSVVKRAVLAAAGRDEAELRSAYQRYADAGEAAGALLAGRTNPAPWTLAEAGAFLAQLAAARGPAAKIELLRERLAALTAAEGKYLVKIIGGDLRIGLKEGLVEEAVAASCARPVGDVRAAHLRCGDLAAVLRAARAGELAAIVPRVFHPLQFMLASPEPTAEALLARLGAPVWLEEKYDGIRCQLHKAGDRVELYSRDLHRISAQFPDLVRAAASLPGAFIADGELLAWRDGRALPFAELQKRLGRHGDDFFLGAELPVSISCYDLLWRDGRSLLEEPLAARRALLAALLPPAHERLRLAPVQAADTAAAIEAAFLAARRRGNEGLMAKDPRSPYTPGRRGLAWLKLKKAYATLDVVVVGAEYGHGRRRDVLSDYTFAVRDEEGDRLLTVGKAYSGLTDAEIAGLTRHFLERTIETRGRYRVVVPDTVIEVAFDSIRPSARHQSGFAPRFPRIARLRPDKTPAEIDTLDTCRRLAGDGAVPAAGRAGPRAGAR